MILVGRGWKGKTKTNVVYSPLHADCTVEACLDFVFCIDTTGSMGDDIDNVKVNMDKINRELFLKYDVDTRAAVVNYRDFSNRTKNPIDFPYHLIDFIF